MEHGVTFQERAEHLTTEQLSAYIDKQLTPHEQAVFDAHFQSCQRCQQRLAELRYTVSLVHALPKVEAPRSFTLPAGSVPLSIEHARRDREQLPNQRRRASRSMLRRTVRVVSTLAAVLGILFVLSGLLSTFTLFGHIGGASLSSAPASNSAGQSNQHPSVLGPNDATTATSRANVPPYGAATKPVVPTPTVTSERAKSTSTPSSGSIPANQGPFIPPALDITMPEGRLGVGMLVLFMGIIGLIATRRRRSTVF